MAEGDCRTVLVKGLNKRTSTETLENYFSSSRRGGEISSIEHDQENGTAFITFASPEGVQKALKDAHTINEKNLTLEVKSSESMEPHKIYVEGFGEKTTRDTLKYYIEIIADTNVLDITFGPRCNAIITVEDTPDKNGSGNLKNSKHNPNNDNNNNNCSLTETELSTNEDYFRKYPKITSYTQRCSYKEEFMRGYDEYTTIKKRSDLVSNEFMKLREKLEDLTNDSEAAQDIRTEILKLYDEKKKEWTKDRKKIEILYPKLNHIKQLVIQYEQAQVLEAKNQEND